ncbi:hypothetical protein ACFV1W_36600 [Kitasatospora sp. NPDC059648]|uniref:hypothetical protein n=1 Tax=Kitasatospora sp. NPDC059648 TaxID=3346894 RepID=UPI0036C81014
MVHPSPPPLTVEAARELQLLLRAGIGPGLSEQELDDVEARFGFRFAADHQVFLSAGLPHGSRGWPDWRHGDPEDLRERLSLPVEGVLFDVEHNGFWHPTWGPRPEAVPDALRTARGELATVPQLVPVYGHRYLPGPGTHGEAGHPVLSVHQTDIVYYGNDLADYLRHEFTGGPSEPSHARATVDFWSHLVQGCPETAFTTPHDPYAATAQEAVEHLRMLALERLIGRRVDDDQLVRSGLTAVALDVESPSLTLLAGLSHEEYGQASPLFEQVLGELGLAADLPTDDGTGLPWESARWELVRWWLRLIVNGSTAPATGGDVIANDGWGKLARPRALWPLVRLVVEYDNGHGRQLRTPEELAGAIVAEAERLLAGPWPPRGPR